MVRLQKDSWYSSEGQKRLQRRVNSQVAGTRRLISLVFLLALVAILMQKAKDPRYISDFFAALGVPLEQPTSNHASAPHGEPARNASPASVDNVEANDHPDTTAHRPTTPAALDDQWASVCRDLIQYAFEEASEDQLRLLALYWFSVAPPPNSDSAPLVLDPVHDMGLNATDDPGAQLRALESQVTERLTKAQAEIANGDERWRTQIERFLAELDHVWQQVHASQQWITWTNEQPPAPHAATTSAKRNATRDDLNQTSRDGATSEERSAASTLEQIMTDWLDARLLRGLVQAAPWKRRESVAFWRLLQRVQRVGRPNSVDHVRGPLIGSSQLLAEGQQWIGRSVQFAGEIRRFEMIERGFAPFAVRRYAICWLRAADGSNQPIPVYLPEKLAEQLKSQDDLSVTGRSNRRWRFTALIGKKLAYAAPAGLQITTTLFAFSGRPENSVAQAAGVVSTRAWWYPYAFAMTVGGLAGALVALIIFRRRRNRMHLPDASAGSRLIDHGAALLVAIVCAAANTSHAQAPTESENRPPWMAKPAAQQRAELLSLRLQQSVNGSQLQELADLIDAEQPIAHTPDVVLKLLQILHQFGFDSLPDSTTIEFGEDFRLQPASITGWCELVQRAPVSDDQLSWFAAESQLQPYQLKIIDPRWNNQNSDGSGANERAAADRGDAATSQEATETNANQNEESDISDSQRVGGNSNPSANAVEATEATENHDGQTENGGDRPKLEAPLTVWSLRVPRFWIDADRLRQPAVIRAWTIWDTRKGRIIAALSQRVGWKFAPDQLSRCQPPVPPRYRGLAAAGWDLGWIDVIKEHNERSLERTEAEGLFTLLQAVEKEPPLGSQQVAAPVEDPVKVLNDSTDAVLTPIRWQVRLLSGKVVEVDHPDDRRALGAGHYYQLDGFVDIGDRVVLYRTPDVPESEPIEFSGEFPVTLLLRTPNEFVPRDVIDGSAKSWQIGKFAKVTGRFYRLWAYRSQLLEMRGSKARQLAPLIVVAEMQQTIPPVRSSADSVWFTFALGFVLLLILGGMLYSVGRTLRFTRRRR